MTKKEFMRILNAVKALGYTDRSAKGILYRQDLISWK